MCCTDNNGRFVVSSPQTHILEEAYPEGETSEGCSMLPNGDQKPNHQQTVPVCGAVICERHDLFFNFKHKAPRSHQSHGPAPNLMVHNLTNTLTVTQPDATLTVVVWLDSADGLVCPSWQRTLPKQTEQVTNEYTIHIVARPSCCTLQMGLSV